jgi:hypothetical protein
MGIDITVLCTYDYVFQMLSTNILQSCCFELEQKPVVNQILKKRIKMKNSKYVKCLLSTPLIISFLFLVAFKISASEKTGF